MPLPALKPIPWNPNPHRKKRQPTISQTAWKPFRDRVQQLYVEERKTEKQVRDLLAICSELRPSKRQLVRQLHIWGLRKNKSRTSPAHVADKPSIPGSSWQNPVIVDDNSVSGNSDTNDDFLGATLQKSHNEPETDQRPVYDKTEHNHEGQQQILAAVSHTVSQERDENAHEAWNYSPEDAIYGIAGLPDFDMDSFEDDLEFLDIPEDAALDNL